jgi:hypothetical protein
MADPSLLPRVSSSPPPRTGVVRDVVAVIAGVIISQILTIIVAIAVDMAAGGEVSGGRWPLNLPNFIILASSGGVSGYFVGLFAQRREKILAGISCFFPLVLILAIAIYLNRDVFANMDSLDTKPSLWVWLALPFWIVGGEIARRIRKDGIQYIAMTVAGAIAIYGGSYRLISTILMHMDSYNRGGLWRLFLSFFFEFGNPQR